MKTVSKNSLKDKERKRIEKRKIDRREGRNRESDRKIV